MSAQDTRPVEALLRTLCVGVQVVGICRYAHRFVSALEPAPRNPTNRSLI